MGTYEKADQLLVILSNAPVGSADGLFRDDQAKEWMESCVMRAVKKLQAAEYHHANIDSEIQDLRKMAGTAREKAHTGFMRSEQDKVAFELDAFLAAARSCIDFVSGMLALHFKGMDRKTSITSLLKRADEGSAGPFAGLLRQSQEWIEYIRKYRDEYVHYRTIHVTGGYKSESRGGDVVVSVLPVLVPANIRYDKPTTRATRNLPVLADIHEMVGIEGVPPCPGPVSDESKKLAEELSAFAEQQRDMVPVEDFCGQHLEKLHQFVSNSFREVVDLGFRAHVG
jgi:hypothetical protein